MDLVSFPLDKPVQKYYRVQVGAFSKQENAENLMKELARAGFKAYVKYE